MKDVAADTIPGLLRRAAQIWPDHVALVDDGMAVTYAQLDAEATRAARGFLALGGAKGDRIALWAPNRWEWVAAAVGIQRIGGVLVPLNTRLRGPEVANILRRADARYLVSIGTFLDRYYPAMLRQEVLPRLQRIVVLRDDPPADGAGELGWANFLDGGDGVDVAALASAEAALRPTDIADIMFTSGTTGEPKGAVFDHERSMLGAAAWHQVCGMHEADRYCVFGPFSHNASYKAGWVAAMMCGAAVYWPETISAETVYRLISTHRITVLPAPPTVFQEMHAHPDFAAWDFSTLRFISTGGTTVPATLVRKLLDDFHVPVVTVGYGMTECAGSATSTFPGDDVELLSTSDGRAIAGTEIRVVDAQGRDLPAGQPGEVLIRCKQLLIEYLDDPAATAAAVDGQGWLHSGDIGTLDARGYLKITDRLKDMYIVGGFNVYPAEIERWIGSLPGVLDCAVVGVPDARLGEVGHAFIVQAPGAALTEAGIMATVRDALANYKIPRSIRFVESLPRNAGGKIIKFQLRELATAATAG